MSISIATMVLLCFCLCITSYALAYAVIKVDDNSFQTGGIGIDLNHGEPVITADEFLFEPGMTVEKPFYIQNNGTWAVYYKLYFNQIEENLGRVLDVTILNEEGEVLLSGKLADLTKGSTPAIESALEVDQRQDLTIRFHFPETAGNSMQSGSLTFELSAIAVQTKNNEKMEFE